jgi:uncharacterized protein (TIGR03437 family)
MANHKSLFLLALTLVGLMVLITLPGHSRSQLPLPVFSTKAHTSGVDANTGVAVADFQSASNNSIDLVCDVPVTGTIDNPQESDFFNFNVVEGERVEISVVRGTPSGPNFLPAWRILRADGTPASSCGAYGIGALFDCGPLSAAGNPYRLEVADSGLNDTGAYSVRINFLTTGCPVPVAISLAPASQTIIIGGGGTLAAAISPAQSTATTVTLRSSNTAIATVPAEVMIPANTTSAPVTVMGVSAGSATITATLPAALGGGSGNASVTVIEPSCMPNERLPNDFVPFSQVYYITAPNAAGNRLVVGKMPPEQLNVVPLPDTPNQLFCRPVRLASDLFAIAYIPTASERNGDFSSFAGLLVDPVNNTPFPGGVIPPNRLGDPHAWRIVNRLGLLATVSAASFSGAILASESIVAAFGADLATATEEARTTPLPTTLAGTTVKVRDGGGTQRDAPLYFVSQGQVNFQIPPGTAIGAATFTITSGNGSVSVGSAPIATVAPGLFAANASGQDVAAGVVVRVKAGGSQVFEPVARFDPTQNKFVTEPIDLGPESDRVFLILYGTGIRFQSSLSAVTVRVGGVDTPVLFAGAAPGFVGLDQINVLLPRSLMGRGEVDVELTVDGKAANTVKVNIR